MDDSKLNAPPLLPIPALPEDVVELPLRILLVEDMVLMASWIKEHIDPIREEFPHAIIQIVHTWKEASAYIFSEPPPHVVCLDLILPTGDGASMEWHQTVDQVPAIEARSAVVIITGKDPSLVRDRLLDKEVEVIMKGPDMFERFFLIRAIVRAMQRWRTTKARENIKEIRSGLDRVDQILEQLEKTNRYATPSER